MWRPDLQRTGFQQTQPENKGKEEKINNAKLKFVNIRICQTENITFFSS